MNDIPALTRENSPRDLLMSVYDRLCQVSDFISSNYSDKVSALWYLNERDCDGRKQVVVKTSLQRGTMEYLLLLAEISRILGDAVVYDHDRYEFERSMLNAKQAFAVYPQMTSYIRGRAQCLVVRGDRILMVKHSVDGEEYYVLPGGGRERGETPEQAAVRELSEECNVKGDIIRRVSEYRDPYEDIYFWTYLMDIGEQEPVLGYDPEFSREHQLLREVRWMTLDELSERDRAWLWAAGLISVPQFCEELSTWSREVSLPKKGV